MAKTSKMPPIDQALVGQSPPMLCLKKAIAKLAQVDVTTLITGASGTGKECVARLIHNHSPRAQHPWIAINCGAIPQDLFESELFGHQAGAFTGARGTKVGLIQAADQGTVFLDELSELPPNGQVKLLRVLQERVIRPIGSTREIPINVRIIAATHRDLEPLIDQGKFRLDLFHRLNVARITTPSLAEIPQDLNALIDHLLAKVSAQLELKIKPLSQCAFAALQRHPFPGNVRELEHCLTRGLVHASGDVIMASDLALDEHPSPSVASPPTGAYSFTGLTEMLAHTESQLIQQALSSCHYNRQATAQYLGISERALRYRLSKYPELSRNMP